MSTKRGIMASVADQKIEGAWAVALKVHISIVTLLIPPVIAWSAWITSEQFRDSSFRQSSEQFSQTDGRKLEDKMMQSLGPKIDQVDSRVQGLERSSERIFSKLESIEQQVKDR